MSADPMRAELLPIFLEELDGQVARFFADLPPEGTAPVEEERLQSLFRVAHTLKGAAHAVGVTPIERLCRALELMLTIAGYGRRTFDPVQHAFLVASAEALRDASVRLRAGEELARSPIAALAARGPQ